ncbi:hybrid sensor histidine kinase/response regulator [Hyalangium gracile]|uniref:hybrid sensor histidine kinase/response regulator n=1 Tax=Hyalangium gracile TaxID=394092 RepID=UPI001CCCF623|nr:PAS domain S-box protein [Hyalangium gracile]
MNPPSPVPHVPRAEEAERQHLLGLFLQAPGFLCFLRGREFVVELANAAWFQWAGHRDILGKPVRQALPELEAQGWFELLERVFSTREPVVRRGMRVLLRRTPEAAPSEAFADVIHQPIVDAAGACTGILIQGTDVTQRQQEQHEQQEAAERYRALFSSIDDGFCLMQLLFDEAGRPIDYRFLEANAAFEEHTGLKGVVGRSARELVPDLDASWFQLYGKVALTGETVRFENHAPAMGRWFEVYASRVGRPELRQVALVFKNITERKAAEAKLQESEARFRNMADHAPVMLWVTDTRAQCIYLNQQWLSFTGQTAETGLGLGWLEAVHPDDARRAGAIFLAANEKQESFRLEYRLRRKDGEYRWAIDAASPRFGPDGEFLGYIGSVIDITERKQAEEERELLLRREQTARAQAEEANRLKDEFLATVSHELRTPLTAMLGWVQMLRSGMLTEDKRDRALATVERNARSQAQLIEDLLDVSRILAGKLKLEVEFVDVGSVVEAAMETVRPAAEAKGIRLQVALDSTCSIMGDAARLQQVVWNLLSNAVKFTPKGGRVQVLVERRDSSVEVTVADTGRGIPQDFLPHVFERFRQAEGGTTRQAGGLGLGLSIVRHLVEAQGGTVSAASDGEGQGATFVVRLPLSVARRREPLVPPTLRAEVEKAGLLCPPELEGLRVLVVDDEADTRELLRTMISGCKARVRTAASVAEGLRALQEEMPDVLVSDIGMPEEDGYSFIRKVRALAPAGAGQLPAVALTAYARVEDRTRALLAGFQSHVPKPVEPLELLAVLASLAGRVGGT